MKEVWKDVVGYEGLYQVSNTGKIKSLERLKWNGQGYQNKPEVILKCIIDHKGYYRTAIIKNGIRKNVKPHRLVAKMFIPNPKNKPTVNHIDGNKLNNNVDNLEWATHQEQTDHAIENGMIRYPIYDHENDIIREYTNGLNQKQIAEKYNISCRVGISNILKKNNIKLREVNEICSKNGFTKNDILGFLYLGKSIDEIAKITKLNKQTIFQYRSKFRKDGIKC